MGNEHAIQTHAYAGPRLGRARHRAFLALGGGVAGVLLAYALKIDHPSALYAAAISLAGVSLAIPGIGGRTMLVLAVVCIGAGRMGAALAPPADHLVHRLNALPIDDAGVRRGLVSLDAIVTHALGDPDVGLARYERGVFQSDRTTMLGKAIAVDLGSGPLPTRGRVRISVAESIDDAPELLPGSIVRVTGWMRPPSDAMNPGPPRPPRAPVCTIDTDGWALVAEVSPQRSSLGTELAPLRRLQHRLQSGARSVLGLDDPQTQTDPARALLAALVLGQRDPGYDDAYEPFRRVGLAHLLAISGQHLAILAAATAWVLRASGPGWRVEAIGVAMAVGMLLVIVPARTPIVRAGVMVLALLLARALGRRHDPLAVLAWTALGIMLWDPYQVFGLGYQLSFGLVAAGRGRTSPADLAARCASRWWFGSSSLQRDHHVLAGQLALDRLAHGPARTTDDSRHDHHDAACGPAARRRIRVVAHRDRCATAGRAVVGHVAMDREPEPGCRALVRELAVLQHRVSCRERRAGDRQHDRRGCGGASGSTHAMEPRAGDRCPGVMDGSGSLAFVGPAAGALADQHPGHR